MSIKIYNSESKKVENEIVCQEFFMKFLYSNFIGKFLLWALIKRKFFSWIFGLWADSFISKHAVSSFVKNYKIDLSESEKSNIKEFKNFNEFFSRKLKNSARPLPSDENVFCFPCDGRHLAIENLSQDYSLYVKGQKMNLAKLLGCKNLAKRFDEGSMLISRLSPLDYHRYHYCASGNILAQKNLGGFLYSVSPIALKRNLNYLLENKRVLTLIELNNQKICAYIEVGATNVGRIINFAKPSHSIKRGEQKGKFEFGGSCVITLYEKGAITFTPELLEYSKQNIEYYSKANKSLSV